MEGHPFDVRNLKEKAFQMVSESPGGSNDDKVESDASLSFGSAFDDLGVEPLKRRSVGRAGNPDNNADATHPQPRAVHYDTLSETIVVEFVNDAVFTVPARVVREFIDVTQNEIADVELQGEKHLHWRSRGVSLEISVLVSGNFGHRSYIGSTETAVEPGGEREPPVPPWAAPVIEFLSDNLPGSRQTRWYHDFLTAYQIACETLIALGHADEAVDGAIPRLNPTLPAILPRLDDVAVAVLYLAGQAGLIAFLPPTEEEKARQPEDTFESLHHAGGAKRAARAHPKVVNVLRLLGMLHNYDWTEAAETVLWRENPTEWRIDFTNDPRFLRAVDDACDRMPDSIRYAIDQFSQITEADIEVYTSVNFTQDSQTGSVFRLPPQTREQAIDTVLWIRRFDFDELFYKFWRINDGWLRPEEARRALEIFNDPLAIAVRKLVAARLYPHLPHLAN
jgi:hypothetical protein